MAVKIIAEAGLNHCGNFDLALDLCEAAKASGADIVKFQTFQPNTVPASLRPLWFRKEKTLKVARHCEALGIEFCSTPDDVDSLRFLVEECGVRRIKMGSGSMTYRPLMRKAFDTGLPMIVSTGMATIGEIHAALAGCYIFEEPSPITLLHCVSLYPCPLELANVRAMVSLQKVFSLPVGYSDHTEGWTAVCAAVSLGACVIEKHLVLERGVGAPDDAVSAEPREFQFMVDMIRHTETALGDGRKEPGEQERAMIPRIRKTADGKQPGP